MMHCISIKISSEKVRTIL